MTGVCFKIIFIKVILQESDLISYLREELESRDKELFLVVVKDVEKEQGWLQDQTNYANNIGERDAEILQLKDIMNEDFNVVFNPLCSNSRNVSNASFQ